jgi:LysM repeat protein
MKDYVARFSLELVILSITLIAVFSNLSLVASANSSSPDQSVIFSFLKSNPNLNNPLLASADTTTILAKTDQWVNQAFAATPFSSSVALTSAPAKNSISGDPTTIQENVIVKTNPAGTANFAHQDTTEYEVKSGDTIVSIATSFGISPTTIMMENKLTPTSTLKPGQKLVILPTTGVSYTVKAGDTTESIAKKYNISEDDLLDINDLELPDDISIGLNLIIPLQKVDLPAAATPKFVNTTTGKIALKQATAPANLSAGALKFIWPTTTRNITQGFHSRHNGLDISNSQRVPVYAAEDGFVEISGWQTGYGNTIVINHGNGFKTRYAHNGKLYVSAGDKVAKGQEIAQQGNTGRVRGKTGIHLHFEILKNGARVNPLAYVKP